MRKFIRIPTVSSEPLHREDCRQGAIFLRKVFTQLGAEATLLSGAEGRNPLVLGTFKGRGTGKKPRILFVGHYDVVSADPSTWADQQPFEMSGRDGFLYGRGVSDQKGPVLAVACAASSLLEQRNLDVDVVMLVEGEEESGSAGFKDAVQRNRHLIGEIDAILVSRFASHLEHRTDTTRRYAMGIG